MNKVETKLACGHTIRQTVNSPNAAVGEQAYCRFCGWQEVTDVYMQEWRVICTSCQMGKWCGQNKSHAWSQATAHEYMKRGHHAFAVLDTITPSGGTPRKSLLQKRLPKPLTAEMESLIVVATGEEQPPPF